MSAGHCSRCWGAAPGGRLFCGPCAEALEARRIREAAPQMLEALEALVSGLTVGSTEPAAVALGRAQAAIAKARGK